MRATPRPKKNSITSERKRTPATTPEGRINQLTALAYDLAEQRLKDGSATSQEVTYFLKEGSIRKQLEIEKLRAENELLKKKAEALESSKHQEEMYTAAIRAMRTYSGFGDADDEDY